MNRSTLALALTACLSATASAVMVAPNGRGEVLILPYYTVEAGQNTLLSLTNHTDSSKALQVKFREALNGRTVMSFNLYLGKRDVWTAAVFEAIAAGPAALVTNDSSCTVPRIHNAFDQLPVLPSGQTFVPFRNLGYTGNAADGGPVTLQRTRSGYVEIIELATLVEGSASAVAANTQGGAGCNTLVTAWSNGGYWNLDPTADTAPPSGGLSATVNLVDVPNGSLAAYSGTALQQFSSIAQHVQPDSPAITLASAVTDAQAGTVSATLTTENGPRVSTWPRARAIEAVSAALSQASLGNEYLVDPGLAAASEWVVAFPTRGAQTDAALGAPIAPFTQSFQAGGGACETVGLSLFNRERATTGLSGTGFTALNLCGAVQVVSFGAVARTPSRLLGALSPVHARTESFSDGYAELDFSAFQSAPANGGERWRGLPAVGFWLWRYQNNNAQPGLLGLYSGTAAHSGVSSTVD